MSAKRSADPFTDIRAIIKARLRRAGAAIRRSPMPSELRCLVGSGSVMPEVVHTQAERMELERDHEDSRARGLRKHDRPRPAALSPREIQERDECLGWLWWLAEDERGIVLGKMLGFGERRIARIDPLRRAPRTIGRVYDGAITKILLRLIAGSTTS